jgi:predicted NACHT family NTPase
MLDVLIAATGVELGKLVLEQVLNLGKAALEDYVKDFFKDCIKSGVARANAETLKKPMAEAIGYFIKRFIKELQFNDVSDTSIQHHFKRTIQQFVRDKAVRPILGKAFEKNCQQINYTQLQQIWTQQYQVDGWQFPSQEFDWHGVAKEYVIEVKGIIKANAELQAILQTELLEDIARNTAQLSPGFDVAGYRASLQSSYGYLKLYLLDSTDRADTIKLWNMFIEQTVREALPPMRYELPLDLKRQLQAEGQLDDLSPEALEHYRREYFQQPSRKVLEAVAEVQQAVILGDPGAGKSTLLQYLAMEWVEGKTETLPLLIELREYVLADSGSFLDFLHRGRGADWQFDQQQLHQHLLEHPTLVMFDGLDEVFDRSTQSAVIDDIIRFAQQYSQARVLVTSRIIGYSPERFRHAKFRQFTIQSLDETEIHEFIDRWYDLAMGSDADKMRLKQRLKDAITNSKTIANLADNPLLLTMMAILNRRQELPRDRADLYDQASRVLLERWDLERKQLQLPMSEIKEWEKQKMLCLIAYEMQTGEEGLKANLISAERLTRVLTDYLRDQGFSEPREKASQLIDQLRYRNWLLCNRGADTYGFVHRTFLEYFCAVEIVYRFEEQRILTFEQLRDEIFGQHWQDETWHEVLRLICGMIDAKFAGELIEFLIIQKVDGARSDLFSRKEISNLLLATQCLMEVKNSNSITTTSAQLLEIIKRTLENEAIERINFEAVIQLAEIFATAWSENSDVLTWLESHISPLPESPLWWLWWIGYFAMTAIIRGWKNSIDILPLLKTVAQQKGHSLAAQAAVEELAKNWKDDPGTLPILKELLTQGNEDTNAREAAVKALVGNWKDDPDTLPILKNLAQQDEAWIVQLQVLRALSEYWSNDLDTLSILKRLAQQGNNSNLRLNALLAIIQFWRDIPGTTEFLCGIVINDPFVREKYWEGNPRQIALDALLTHYATHPKTLELLHDRAINDPDEQLREWAQEQLQQIENERQ